MRVGVRQASLSATTAAHHKPQMKTAPASHSGNEASAALIAAKLKAAFKLKLEDLFESGRLDMLEEWRCWRQFGWILVRHIKSPIADRRLINYVGRNVRPWTHRLCRMIKRYERANIIPPALNRVPIFNKAGKIDHAAIQARFVSITLVGCSGKSR